MSLVFCIITKQRVKEGYTGHGVEYTSDIRPTVSYRLIELRGIDPMNAGYSRICSKQSSSALVATSQDDIFSGDHAWYFCHSIPLLM